MLNYKIFREKSSVINIKIFQFYVILIFQKDKKTKR